MAQTYTLHSTKENKNTYKTLIAAKYAGASVELVSNFEFGKSNKTPEFLKMNPNGKVIGGISEFFTACCNLITLLVFRMRPLA